MKILLVARGTIGMGSFFQPLALTLATVADRLYVLGGKINRIDKVKEMSPGITWIEADTRNMFAFTWKLRSIYKQIKPDLIYFYNPGTIPCAYLSGIFFSRTKFVYHNDEYLEPKSFPIYKKFEKNFCQNACLVVCNEPNRARFMAAEYHLREAPLAVPGALSKFMAPQADAPAGWGKEKKDFVDLVYAGGIEESRLILYILRSLNFLPKNFRLTIFGQGATNNDYWQRCEQVIESSNLRERVIINNPIPNEELLQKLLKYDVGVLLYNDDTLGNYYCQPQKLYEYVACGMPVVGPNYAGMELTILKYGLGAVCHPKSPESIARAILQVAAPNSDERMNQFRRMRRVFFESLAYENNVSSLKEAFERIKEGEYAPGTLKKNEVGPRGTK